MNFIKIFIRLSVFSIFLGGCMTESSNYAKIIMENQGADWPIYVAGDSTQRIISLKMTENSFIGSFDKILMNDSLICILDKGIAKGVFVFNHSGELRSKILRTGRGPGEYISPDDVALKEDTVLIYDRNNRKMLYYNLQGECCKETYFKTYRPIPFAIKDEGHFVFYFGMPGFSEDNSEVVETDLAGNITNQYIARPDLTEAQGRFHLPYYFAQNSEGVFFIPVFGDKIYQITTDSIRPVFDFRFKSQMYSFDEIGSQSMIEQKDKYSYFSDFHMTDDGSFVCFIHRGNISLVHLAGNIHTGKLMTWKGDSPIIGVYQNYFITVMESIGSGTDEMNISLVFIKSERLTDVAKK